ncbi:MmcQ/YjbR family DNA-binding protein [Phaeobacter inhibens]|uniref:MmcQ/YjbR family DNA-binding protein n=1 Tax=Phaeobacter inhibens TaxID=221822 RepID=UPI0021A68D86|nr:MmcQ/YjbR family DNA-binding protein [Phaeobacter inhibens]UWR53964.1 MmcQ/YjbR family DNA-binding protein [Phaeobacter inhibens]UWR65578.1 MmcQ/YjbR family DNA-binding protein [Phaeobacter inhibens]
MTREEFNSFCATFPATSHVVQWGNADVWKAGGKVFAICGWADGKDAFTFKTGEIAFEVLQERPGVRPAPYLASRGMKWLQHFKDPGLSDAELKEQISLSYNLVTAGLSKRKRAELGIPEPQPGGEASADPGS